jgi:hypothetical protein
VDPLRLVTDLGECRELWERLVPQETISDLWEVRACFQKHFQRPARFIVAGDPAAPSGLLPLSWIDESACCGYFPGETWHGKTWLEQNRVIARGPETLAALVARSGPSYHVRYLLPCEHDPAAAPPIDEIGYLFLPPQYGYDMENYFGEFSHKSAKRIRKELAAIESLGLTYRRDDLADFERLVELNMGRFGADSYFADPRFLGGFRDLVHLLAERGWLRVTTVIINGEPAAIDVGCMYRGTYTLLGGGTHGGYPGIAKLINLHHMRRACEERLDRVDFLCGDFSWKKLFHLTPRPLYLISNVPAAAVQPVSAELEARSAACV